jgi:hypothetical protein
MVGEGVYSQPVQFLQLFPALLRDEIRSAHGQPHKEP